MSRHKRDRRAVEHLLHVVSRLDHRADVRMQHCTDTSISGQFWPPDRGWIAVVATPPHRAAAGCHNRRSR